MSFMPFIWLGLTGIFLVLAFAKSYDLTVWLVADAIIVAIMAFSGASLLSQLIVFVVLGVLFCVVSKRLSFASLRALKETQSVRANPEELVGRRGVVVISVRTDGANGLVSLSGEKWLARAADGSEIAQGTEVEVVSLRGQKLLVRPV